MIPTLYEPFRHWSEGGSVFILSDLHFDDSDCKLVDPNWIAAEEQVAIINKLVGKGDTFVCLGDVGNPKYVPMIKARKKILLLGNHDAKGAYNGLFDEIYTGPLFIADKILLSHEPVYGLSWCLKWHGGRVHKIRPSVIHLMRGQVFEIDGKRIFAFGGASSHDIDGGILEPDYHDNRNVNAEEILLYVMARMIMKYGKEVLAEIEAEEMAKAQESNT